MNIKIVWFNPDGSLNKINNWELNKEEINEIETYGILNNFDFLVNKICSVSIIQRKLEIMDASFCIEKTFQYKLVKRMKDEK